MLMSLGCIYCQIIYSGSLMAEKAGSRWHFKTLESIELIIQEIFISSSIFAVTTLMILKYGNNLTYRNSRSMCFLFQTNGVRCVFNFYVSKKIFPWAAMMSSLLRVISDKVTRPEGMTQNTRLSQSYTQLPVYSVLKKNTRKLWHQPTQHDTLSLLVQAEQQSKSSSLLLKQIRSVWRLQMFIV